MKHIFTAALLLSVVACTDTKNSKSNAVDTVIPTSLAAHDLVVRPMLNAGQMAELSTFSERSKLIPTTDLYIVQPDETSSDRDRRSKDIRKLEGSKLQVHSLIQSQCRVQQPVPATQGDLKTPGSTETTQSTASIRGTSCPVEVVESKNKTTVMVATNYAEIIAQYYKDHDEQGFKNLTQNGNWSQTKQSTMVIKDANLQQLSGLRIVESIGTDKVIFARVGNATDYHSTSLINLKATTSVGSVATYKISVEAVSRAGVSQSYFEYDVQMPTSNPILQVYVEGTTKRFFLNGSPTTALAIKTLLGIDLDSASDQE